MQVTHDDNVRDMAAIRHIPKVELHCHLEACFRRETVMEVGRELGLDMPQNTAQFEREWLLREPLPNLADALGRFVAIQKIWCTEEVIERMAREACEDAIDQGIRVMEFRYSPDFIAADKPHLSFDRIHQAIVRGIGAAESPAFAVGLIGIVQKTLSLAEAEKTIDFITDHADTFVALDFADKETLPLSAYKTLINRARDAGLHMTVHAGEEPSASAPQEIRDAIEDLGAKRIGHGLHVLRDPQVVKLVKERDVALELCPTSNWLTGSVPSTAQHPIRRLQQEGLTVTINSDDPSLFGIDLCHEYRILQREHDFSAVDFEQCNLAALAHSFIPEEQKRRAWDWSTDG